MSITYIYIGEVTLLPLQIVCIIYVVFLNVDKRDEHICGVNLLGFTFVREQRRCIQPLASIE